MTFTTVLFRSAWYLKSSNIFHTHDSNNKPKTIIKKLPQHFAVIVAQLLILNMSITYSFLLSSSIIMSQNCTNRRIQNLFWAIAFLSKCWSRRYDPLLIMFTCFLYSIVRDGVLHKINKYYVCSLLSNTSNYGL